MNELTVNELFSGIGAFRMALINLGIPHKVVGISEIDKYAIKSYNAMYGETRNYGDISKVDRLDYADLWSYGFPCCPAGTKIYTEQGYKNIEDVCVGDYVLTHNNRFRKVLNTMERTATSYYTLSAVGTNNQKFTANHPVYIYRNGEFKWVSIKDVVNGDYISFNVNQLETTTNYSDDYLWLLGRYIADGYKAHNNSIVFCIGKEKAKEFESCAERVFPGRWKTRTRKGCTEYRIADKELKDNCLLFGVGAKNKVIPNEYLNLNKEQLKVLLDGYFSGDGHHRKNRNQIMYSTTSKNLFLSVQFAVAKVYGKIVSLNIRKPRKESQSFCYNGQFSLNDKYLRQKQIDGKLIGYVNGVKLYNEPLNVFNIEVQEDNSYTADNIIVHNCQDISLAGLQKGIVKGETRSGLLYEVERLLYTAKETDTLPKYLIMENVKPLIGAKFKPDFDRWLGVLDSLGYDNYYQVLNAKDYGIPQNRERVFCISIRKDLEQGFEFPKKIPLTKTVIDFLEKDVDEKYYLSDDYITYAEQSTLEQRESGNGFDFEPLDFENGGAMLRKQ